MSMTSSLGRLKPFQQALILGYRQISRQFDRSKVGIFWIPLNYFLHVALIGIVFRYVWQDENFLLFFSYSYLSWRILIDPVVEGSHFWKSSYSYLWHLGINPNILVSAWFMADLLKTLLWLIPTLIFTSLFLGSMPIYFFSFLIALIFLRISGFLAGYIFSFAAARFWELSQTINTLVLLAYLLSPVFWSPDRLTEEHKWLVEINPIYYFIELPRNFALGTPSDVSIVLIALLMSLVLLLGAYICHKKFKNKAILWVN